MKSLQPRNDVLARHRSGSISRSHRIFAAGIEGGVNFGSEDLLRLWIALSGFQAQDLELLFQRYGFSENGPQSFGQIAKVRGCDKETVRRKLIRVEAELKKRLMRKAVG